MALVSLPDKGKQNETFLVQKLQSFKFEWFEWVKSNYFGHVWTTASEHLLQIVAKPRCHTWFGCCHPQRCRSPGRGHPHCSFATWRSFAPPDLSIVPWNLSHCRNDFLPSGDDEYFAGLHWGCGNAAGRTPGCSLSLHSFGTNRWSVQRAAPTAP